MLYMLIMSATRDAKDDPKVFGEMGKFAGELAARGKLMGGAPLHPEAEGVRIRQTGGTVAVIDGPFTETKEVIGGFFMIECDSREEALEIAKRCPHAKIGTVELREAIKMGGPPA